MNIADKFEAWEEVFYKYFISLGLSYTDKGSFIPLSKVTVDSAGYKVGVVGDGTINIADLMQYVYVCNRLDKEIPIKIIDCIYTLERLSKNAKDFFVEKFPNINYIEDLGFFLRDDILYPAPFNVNEIIGAYTGLKFDKNEDPCFSPFVSQDQIWNLNPILYKIKIEDGYNSLPRAKASSFGYAINALLANHDYTLYNPYLSAINHYFHYCPTFNEDKVSPWDRQEDRNRAFTYTDKVKRGANNWYYSGGTQSCRDVFCNGFTKSKYDNTLRTFLYKCIVFGLDRIYHPYICKWFKLPVKDNAYYCYAATSGIWYNNGFVKRVAKKLNASSPTGELAHSNIAFITCPDKAIDWDVVEAWLEAYPEPDTTADMNSPLQFMYIYLWWFAHNWGELDTFSAR